MLLSKLTISYKQS